MRCERLQHCDMSQNPHSGLLLLLLLPSMCATSHHAGTGEMVQEVWLRAVWGLAGQVRSLANGLLA